METLLIPQFSELVNIWEISGAKFVIVLLSLLISCEIRSRFISISLVSTDGAHYLTKVELFVDWDLTTHQSMLLAQMQAGLVHPIHHLLPCLGLHRRLRKSSEQPVYLVTRLASYVELRARVEIVRLRSLLRLLQFLG